MAALFFFGTLRDREVLEVVVDRPVAEHELRPAHAPGHAVRRLAAYDFPHLVAEPGARAEGILFEATADEMDRIAFFEDTDYGFAPILVETADGAVEAQYCRATAKLRPGEGLWDYELWRREAQPVALEAARELMGHYGFVPPEEVDAIWPGILTRARMRARAKASTPVMGRLRRRHGPEDVESLELSRPYTGYFAIEEHRLCHRLFDGGWSRPVPRSVLVVGDAATVVPYDARRDLVLLIEQFRAAMFSRGDRCPWGVEAIAGRLDQDGDAEATARREAEEEAGVRLGRVERIGAYYTTPGFAAEQVTSFIGEADLAEAGGLHGEASEHEDIRAFVVSLDEALGGVASGEIDNAPAILSLLWLARNRERLRAEWGPPGLERRASSG